MSSYLVNLVDGLTTCAVTWSGIAWGHHRTCDCRAHRAHAWARKSCGRFLPGAR